MITYKCDIIGVYKMINGMEKVNKNNDSFSHKRRRRKNKLAHTHKKGLFHLEHN